jgi:flavoprotein
MLVWSTILGSKEDQYAASIRLCNRSLTAVSSNTIASKCIGCNTYHKVAPYDTLDDEEKEHIMTRWGNQYVENNFTVIIGHVSSP